MLNFFNYKLNRKILLAFLFIIIFPGMISFLFSFRTLDETIILETEDRLLNESLVYLNEIERVKNRCLDIVTIYSEKKYVREKLKYGGNDFFEEELIDFTRMDIVDIIEIADAEGNILFRGHNPAMSGDNKIGQELIRKGLAGEKSVAFERGRSGFAIRAAAPVRDEGKIIGLVMAGSLLSSDFVNRMKDLTLLENGIYIGKDKLISTYEGQEALDDETLELVGKGEPAFLKGVTLNSAPFMVIVEPVFLWGELWGAISLGISEHEIQKVHLHTGRQLIYIVASGLLLAFVIYLILAGNINRSLVKIVSGINSLSLDGSNEEIDLRENDEFGLIARNYNSLIRRIDEYNNEIETLQQDLLISTKLATAGKISANLAHEIRNPLSSMKMMAQIVSSRYLDETRGLPEMNIILQEIDRINDMVRELLEFARPGSCKFEWQDIYPILNSILHLCEHTLSQNEIRLIRDFESGLPELYVNSEKIRVCLMNIVMNAIQAMPDGGNLVVATEHVRDKVMISVSNSFRSEINLSLEQFFEPFFTTKREGTGLGLAIAKLEVDRHNGTIHVTQSDDHICFKIALPTGSGNKELEKWPEFL